MTTDYQPMADAPVQPARGGTRWQRGLALAGLLLVLAGYNHAVWRNERQLASGQVVRLALAPRDPRALLTGDYMALNYALAADVQRSIKPAAARREPSYDSFAIVAVDDRRLATLVRVQPAPRPRAAGEVALRVRARSEMVMLGTNAFYFLEGQAAVYQPARFGEFRGSDDGQMLLVSLLDQDMKPLLP